MAYSVNKVILVGNVGKDPETRVSNHGYKTSTLTLATSQRWKDKQGGEMKEKTEWHKIVVFNPHLVEVVEKYIRKGSKLYVEGALTTRKWADKQGVDHYTTEVVLSAFNGELVLLSEKSHNSDLNQEKVTDSDDLDDEVPF
jgi:single-strand DNA-binding protein